MKHALLAVLLCACGPDPGPVTPGPDASRAPPDAGAPDAEPFCTAGVTRCDGQTFQRCDGDAWVDEEECPLLCNYFLGCVVCDPFAVTCEENVVRVCHADGLGSDDTPCGDELVCHAPTQSCKTACEVAELEPSNSGCEFWPVATTNGGIMPAEPDPLYHFAITISNESADRAASVTVEGGGLAAPLSFDVAPLGIHTQFLPWDLSLSDEYTGSLLVPGASYVVRSDRPVIVYQFSPYEALASNDASLLFPTGTLGTSYRVMAHETFGFIAVTATQPSTTVTVTPSIELPATASTPLMPAGVPTTVLLNDGDVLQLLRPELDLTGSLIEADQNVQVIGGSYCMNLPASSCCCDHTEDLAPPIKALGRRYVIAAPALPPTDGPEMQRLRIIATEDDTTLVYDPPVPGAATTIALAGEFVTVYNTALDFELTADKKVLVAQYMLSMDAAGAIAGDPAINVAVPYEQYRAYYLFHTPLGAGYAYHYANITAPVDASVMIDGLPVTLTPVAGTGWGAARVLLDLGPGGDGNHAASGDVPFGISVYGTEMYTSYWYPGGMDLREVVPTL